jgi:uracil-DNA glycosylase
MSILRAHLPRDPAWRAVLLSHLDSHPADEARLAGLLGGPCLPAPACIFAACDATPLERVRVLVLGQDPYPTPGDAHGLAFSVEHGRPPASLRNIFAEIERDCGGPRRQQARLDDWAAAGVLLLNRVLSVAPGEAGSHRGQGWEALTAACIAAVLARPGPLAVLLWGNDAQTLAPLCRDRPGTLVIATGHPSPLAYHRAGFKACGCFAAVNRFLSEEGQQPIDWRGAASPHGLRRSASGEAATNAMLPPP